MYNIKGYISYSYRGKLFNETFELTKDKYNDKVRIISYIEEALLGNRIKVTIIPKSEVILKECYLLVDIDYSGCQCVFLNGFQSWSESREYLLDEQINKLNPIIHGILKNYGGNNILEPTGEKGNFHSFTYSYIRKSLYEINLWGSLDETKGYTVFGLNTNKNTLRILKDCANLTINSTYNIFDIFTAADIEKDVFEAYFGLMDIEPPRVETCTGWTSWYNYYNKIDEKIILRNLKSFTDRNIEIDIFQIDDGYEKAVGDWLETNPKFKNGMKPIVDEIKKSGYKAGLWLAPFICEKNSDIYRDHPEWILRYENGKKVRAGFNGLWSYNFYALDIYNEEVRTYLKKVFENVFNNWGFDIVKLDFLYAAGILPTAYKTRGEVMHDGMKLLREFAGDKIILGCGVPLGAAFGMVEYCRIGSDINPKWEDKLLKCLNAQERVSSLAAIDSAISRHQMNSRAFYNDPDVFILRKGNNYLTDSQKRSLYIINLVFGGLVFTSDNIGEYSETEMKLYLSHFPHKPKKINYVEKLDKIYKISFNINDREYMVISNLGEKAKALSLKKGEYIRFLSKDNMDILFVDKEKFITIAPYDTLCFYKMKGAAYELLGGSGHVFSGSEIKNFKVSEDNITLELSQRAILKEVVYIKVPMALENIKVNGLVLKTEEIKGLNIVKYDWDVNGVYFNKDVLRFKNYITEKPDELSVN